jgi:hypothetical protein
MFLASSRAGGRRRERGVIMDVRSIFSLSNSERSYASMEIIARGGHYTVGCVAYERGKLRFNAASRSVVNWKAE